MRVLLCVLAVGLILGAVAGLAGCGGEGTTIMPAPGGLGDASRVPVPITTKEEAMGLGKWTILVYLDADNDLESYGINNINQMELVGSSRDVRVVVQVDRTITHDISNGNWDDTRRYLITRDTDTAKINSIRMDADAPLGELDMGSWRTLKSFVEWGAATFPAEHYCVVLWNHGTGWEFFAPSSLGTVRPEYIATDDTSGSAMDVTDIPKAFTSLKPDVLAFDACLMQQLEIAYQLRNCTSYIVGASGAEPSPGYNYSRWLATITSATTPKNLCGAIVREFVAEYPEDIGITQSAVDVSKIPAVAVAAGNFAQVLKEVQAANPAGVAAAREAALNFSTGTSVIDRHTLDLLDYAYRAKTAVGPSADFAYSVLADAVKAAVVAEGHGPDMSAATGLSIYCPPPGKYESTYVNLDLALFTEWDEWLRAQAQ